MGEAGRAQSRRDYEADARADGVPVRGETLPQPPRVARLSGDHPCPGGCGDWVPAVRLACPVDWARLPKSLRDELGAAYRGRFVAGGRSRHIAALRDASVWYRLHPRTD